MYWRKSCACCRNWKSSLHGSRWLILIKLLKIIGYKPTELSIYKGRLKNKKQPTQPIFLAEPLIATTAHPLSRGRELERGQQASRLVILAVRVLGKIAAIRRIPSPQPSPTGEGAGCSRFCGCRRFEKQLGFTTVDAGRLKNKKQPAQPIFLVEPLIPTVTRPLSPWERARERATSRKACILGD